MLSGKKTYITAVLIGVTAAAHALGYITDGQANSLIGLLTGAGLAALRNSIK